MRSTLEFQSRGAVLVVFLLISLGVLILICALLYSALSRVPPEHRQMEPGLVWLLLIPIFSLVWNFFVVIKTSKSYESYFASIGRTDVGQAGFGVGLAYAICAACSIIPILNYLTGIATLVLIIIYLVQISGLKNQIPPAAV